MKHLNDCLRTLGFKTVVDAHPYAVAGEDSILEPLENAEVLLGLQPPLPVELEQPPAAALSQDGSASPEQGSEVQHGN